MMFYKRVYDVKRCKKTFPFGMNDVRMMLQNGTTFVRYKF